jgi:hypothetical protein
MVKNASELRKGDVLLALDSWQLPRGTNGSRLVEIAKFIEVYDDGTVVVEVKQDKTWTISPRRYLRHKQVEIARWSTICGKRWLKLSDELYESPDGVWSIERHDMESECEDRHPVKLTHEMVRDIKANPSQWCYEARTAVEERDWRIRGAKPIKGYMCPGGEYHTHPEWVPHRHDVPNFDHGGAWSDTPTSAIEPFINEVN